MNKREYINKIYNKLIFIIEILVSLILGIGIYKISYKYQDFNYISKPYLILSLFSLVILIMIIIINIKKYKKQIEKLFITFIIPIGILFMILLPINFVPDEESHMWKTYDISLGNLITPFGENNEGKIYVPQELQDLSVERDNLTFSLIHKHFQKEADYQNLVPVEAITKTYCPINYLPGALVFFVCRVFNINILLACNIIRLINFIIFMIVGYYCIKIIPFGKLLLAIYMFLPMFIQQAASISADSFINNVSLLFIVYNIKLLYQKEDLNLKQRMLYYILAIGIALSKYVYFPLVGMSLLLIKNKNIKKANRNKLIIISILVSIISAVAWFVFSQNYVDLREIIIINNVKPMEQIKYIIHNPIKYLLLFIENLKTKSGDYIFTFIGSQLALLNINIPIIYILIMLNGLIVLPFFENNEKSFEKPQKILSIIIAIVLITLVITGLYITWTGVGDNRISGVQGRYFVPIFILILLSMINKSKNINVKNLEIKYFIIYFIINLLCLVEVYKYFTL